MIRKWYRFWLLLAAMAPSLVFGFDREETARETLSGVPMDMRGYCALNLSKTQLVERDLTLMGFEGGWTVHPWLLLGAAGKGLPFGVSTEGEGRGSLNFFYLGPFVEALLFPNKVIHGSLSLHAAYGQSGYRIEGAAGAETETTYPSDEFTVLEPSLQGIVNITRRAQISVGVSLRRVSGFELDEFTDESVSGKSYHVGLRGLL